MCEAEEVLLQCEGPSLGADAEELGGKCMSEDDDETASRHSDLCFSAYRTRLPCSKNLFRSKDASCSRHLQNKP